MSIGLCYYTFTHLGAQYDAYDLMNLAEKHGLAGAEFPPEECLPDLSEESLQKARQYAADRGQYIVADGGIVEVGMLRRLIPAAHGLGTPTLRVILSGILGGDRRSLSGKWDEYLQNCIRVLGEVLPVAEEYGVSIAVENHSDATSRDLLILCETLDSPHIGITLDTGNVLSVLEEPIGYATRLMPFLKNVHLKDYTIHPSDEGYRIARCALGRGVVDFPNLLPLIEKHYPNITKTVELGAVYARHVRMLMDDYWAEFPDRVFTDMLPHQRLFWEYIRPRDEDWRSPHEKAEADEVLAAYETREFEDSVAYLKRIGVV